ncbi:MAG: type I restriction-modification system endonuclease [Alphaproteobacteria bacterium]|nr:type I restriction-modification system endonuclease [Alphaproteobacteria bacterium]
MPAQSANFAFLAAHDELLVRYAAQAERYFADDPNTALIKLRQFGEVLAQQAAAYAGVYTSPETAFVDVLNQLWDRGVLTPEVSQLFHGLRKAGNAAAHDHHGSQRDALHQLKMARKLAIWFHRSFGHASSFKPGPFTPPPDPQGAEQALQDELQRLREELTTYESQVAEATLTAQQQAALRAQAEARAQAAFEDVAAAMELAEETAEQLQAERQRFDAHLAAAQATAASAPPEVTAAVVQAAQVAGADLDLTEAETRKLIDAQLVEAGWAADSEVLRHSKGTRPAKGRNLAIAEWPTASGPADYVLFVGLTPVGVVEAKRLATNIPARIGQAERYSRDITIADDWSSPGGPWGDFKVPFLFATNGRPYLRQIVTASGIWFRDARRPTNHARALEGWYTPEGLVKLLKQDRAAAEARLATEPADYLPLRDYQRAAIAEVEAAIAAGQRDLLLAMATGTGKTRTAICMVYRLIKAGRFNRVLFLVDRTSLGEQAHEAFKNVKLEQLQSFEQIYDVKGLGDLVPDSDTRLHIATIQGMVHRLLYSSDDAETVPVDQYDCIIVDECHRGYHLDRELSDAELTFRSEADYISKYRRVLDQFDAVRIGLTATPALHTTEIFGDPVFTYSYRQAVIDGHLIDHEPPIRIVTALAEDGIKWLAGEPMEVYRVRRREVDLIHAPDEVTIEVDRFNQAVVTESFNRVVCEELANHIDPSLPGKTLIFAATDAHADLVAKLLKEAFDAMYGPTEDAAVCKITGNAHKPGQLIRFYKNETNPRVAVTVDLLTTGIDVPEIVNLVFIRRIRSRILYEQMLGRATRQCPEIGKQYFRIFDAVDLYSALEPYTSMKPVVVSPKITFVQLVDELASLTDQTALDEVHDQLRAKLQRKARRLTGAAHDQFVTLAGMEPKELLRSMSDWGASATSAWFEEHPDLAVWLDTVVTGDGPVLLISHHEDELRRTERGYGSAEKPEDYLESFGAFVREHLNDLPALMVVTQRPRKLTRQQLKELKFELDRAGFTEAGLRVAWQEATNQDIAATIIGFIRQQALGSPLVPYEERVKRAMTGILSSRAWTMPQRKWLERIGKQLMVETIVDREALDRGQFKAQGGFDRLNKVFGGHLEDVLGEISEAVWEDVG